MTRFDVIGFDADDTLWQSEDGFHESEQRFVEMVAPYVPEGIDAKAALVATEGKNLPTFGYGVKSFGLSMVETAATITNGAIPSSVMLELVDLVRDQLQEPVRLLPDVPQVLQEVGSRYRIVLITKGDLIHQTHKVSTSGLAHHFEHIEIVLEKDAATYAKLIARFGVEPERFCMVGNSVRSDILPVMALGGHGIHVPYHLLWEHEHVDHDEHVTEVARLADVPIWLAEFEAAAN